MIKQQIRSRMKEIRNQLSAEEQSSRSAEIKERFLKTDAYRNCKQLFSFAAFGSEVSTREIILQALKDQKSVYLPKVEVNGMEFYKIQDLEGLMKSKFGVPEPSGMMEFRFITKYFLVSDIGKKYFLASDSVINKLKNSNNEENFSSVEQGVLESSVMLLPGLAFDFLGNRIGYGAGYYDRYLHTQEEAFYKIALAYDFQVMEQIPADPHDIRADLIITPTRVIPCR